jgi:fructose-1,6-bisphosphatase I
VGALVADFHRTLIQGGIYMYPADLKNTCGKLRLLYEASPLAMVAKAAGGAASTGAEDVLDVVPEKLHQRVPLYIGARADVAEAVRLLGT